MHEQIPAVFVNSTLLYVCCHLDLLVGSRDWSVGKVAVCGTTSSSGMMGSLNGLKVLRMGGCAWSVCRVLQKGKGVVCAALCNREQKARAIVSTDEIQVLRGRAPVLLLLGSTFRER